MINAMASYGMTTISSILIKAPSIAVAGTIVVSLNILHFCANKDGLATMISHGDNPLIFDIYSACLKFLQ